MGGTNLPTAGRTWSFLPLILRNVKEFKMEHTHTHTIYVKTNSAKIYRLSQGILFVHYPPDLILNHYPLSRLSVTCHSSPVQTTQYILHMCVCVCGCQGFPYNCMAACQLYLYMWIYLFQCSQSFLYSIILSDALSNLCTF